MILRIVRNKTKVKPPYNEHLGRDKFVCYSYSVPTIQRLKYANTIKPLNNRHLGRAEFVGYSNVFAKR